MRSSVPAAVAALAALGLAAVVVAPRLRTPPEPPVVPAAERDDPDLSRAIDEALAAVAAQPRDPAPRTRLAMLYDVHGFVEHALPAYDHALALGAGIEARWLRARLLESMGRLAEAIPEMLAVRDASPYHSPAHVGVALALARAGNGPESLAAAQLAVDRFPNEGTSWLALAEVTAEHGTAEDAIRAARRAARVAQPTSPVQRRADRLADRLLGRPPAGGAATPSDRDFAWPDPWSRDRLALLASFEGRLQTVSSDVLAGRFEASIPVLRALVARRPADADANSLLAACLRGVGQAAEALPLIETAVRAAPERSGLRLQLALTREAAGDAAGAIRELDAIVRESPADGEALEVRAGVHARAGRADLAVADIDAAAAAGRVTVEGMVIAGTALAERSRLDEAEERFRRATGVDAFAGDGWGGLAWIAALRGDRRRAEEMLARADAVAPWGAPLARRARDLLAR